jgi:hypothetical protein
MWKIFENKGLMGRRIDDESRREKTAKEECSLYSVPGVTVVIKSRK